MKKQIFTVKPKPDFSISSLLKELDKLPGRIEVNFEENIVTAEDIEENMIDTITNFLVKYYTISKIKSINQSDESPSISSPQLVTTTPEIDSLISQLRATINKLPISRDYVEKDIKGFILSTISEITMKYQQPQPISFKIGDIVDCCLGAGLPGEVIGGHVKAIITKADEENMVFIVPIAKEPSRYRESSSYLTLNIPEDGTYSKYLNSSNFVLTQKGRYIHVWRLNSVIGSVTSEFLLKVQKHTTPNPEHDNIPLDDQTISEESVQDAKTTKSLPNIGEDILRELINPYLKEIDSSKPIEDEILKFITSIGLTTDVDEHNDWIVQSFEIACSLPKITLENVCNDLKDFYPDTDIATLKETLREIFKDWLQRYPSTQGKRISIKSIFKLFAKEFV